MWIDEGTINLFKNEKTPKTHNGLEEWEECVCNCFNVKTKNQCSSLTLLKTKKSFPLLSRSATSWTRWPSDPAGPFAFKMSGCWTSSPTSTPNEFRKESFTLKGPALTASSKSPTLRSASTASRSSSTRSERRPRSLPGSARSEARGAAPTRPGTLAASAWSSTQRRATGTWSGTTLRSSSSEIRFSSRAFCTRKREIRSQTWRTPTCSGIFW